MLYLDGNTGEGGGQILRTALALSTLTGISFEIDNIRAQRPNPGLKAQHLNCLNAYTVLTRGKHSPAEIGTSTIRFVPGEVLGGIANLNIGTAGSIPLLFQSILPVLIFSPQPVHLSIVGGTDAAFAPLWDTMQATLLPPLRSYAEISSNLLLRGYYPKGGGKIELHITSRFPKTQPWGTFISETSLPPLEFGTQGTLRDIGGTLHLHRDYLASNAGEQLVSFLRASLAHFKVPINIELTYVQTLSRGGGLSLFARFTQPEKSALVTLASDSILENPSSFLPDVRAMASALSYAIQRGWCVDEHLLDQMIPYLAIAGGIIYGPPPTSHVSTNISICESFLGNPITIQSIHEGYAYTATKPYK